MEEVRITHPTTGASKGVKLQRYDLIPVEPLRMLAELYGKGAFKYDERNWEKGYEFSKSFSALQRHMWLFWSGEDLDEEMGLPHTVCAAWHAFVMTEFLSTHPEMDDRPIWRGAKAARQRLGLDDLSEETQQQNLEDVSPKSFLEVEDGA